MKVLYLTAGAAGMYCGSCLLDNALATELMARGHDVILLPLYTPTLTDEKNVSQPRIFFGGISVYLEQYIPFFRKTPWFFDRLWDSAKVIQLFSGRGISPNPEFLGGLTVSMLKGENGHQRKELDKLLHWLQSENPPEVVHLQNSLLIGLAGPIRRALNRPICVTLQGEDFFLEHLEGNYRREALELMRAKVNSVDAFMVYCEFYAALMTDLLHIPQNKMHVVPMGLNLEGFQARQPGRSEFPRVGYFARVAPEKGLHLLCEAYRVLRQEHKLPPMQLEVAGYLAREHTGYLAELQRKMKSWGLENEFHYHGVLDRKGKIQFLQQLDVFSVPVTFDDPKGLPVLEAMACGVPVVQPKRGSFQEIQANTAGGILVEPEDAWSLAEGIRSVLADDNVARELARRGVEGVHRHYSVKRMADRTMTLYESLLRSAAEDLSKGKQAVSTR
ncbi:MAG: glycosyltransferase family 4 protein [Acidobacteria bacterium]|nr:glycosyltransferase family 4 protein [Acidobacteriota bacterium]MCI0718007.1 glycosyltransferase family 4 protein [Acidobacteriota bacterium]